MQPITQGLCRWRAHNSSRIILNLSSRRTILRTYLTGRPPWVWVTLTGVASGSPIPHAAGEPEIGQTGIGFGDQAREVSSPTPPPAPAVVGLRPGSDRAKTRVRAVRVCRSLDDEGLSNIYGSIALTGCSCLN